MLRFLCPLFLAGWCAVFLSASPASAAPEAVVILHGIARSSSHMKPLAKALMKEGYQVYNLDYPSTDDTFERLVEKTQKIIEGKITDSSTTVHFIGYSMGGLMVRGILKKHRPKNLGRVVLLGTPNRGSEVADFVKSWWSYKKIFGPAGQQLGTKSFIAEAALGKPDYEVGVLAGNFSIDPASSMIIPGPDDGKVSVESTRLEGMKDHHIIPASHTFFPSNKDAIKQTLYFLKHGIFEKTL